MYRLTVLVVCCSLVFPTIAQAIDAIPDPGESLHSQQRETCMAWSTDDIEEGRRVTCRSIVNWFDPCSEPTNNWKVCRLVTLIVIVSGLVTLAIGAAYGFI